MSENKNVGLQAVLKMISKPPVKLKDLLTNGKLDHEKVKKKILLDNSNEMGVYFFWWTKGKHELPPRKKVVLKGPHKAPDPENPAASHVTVYWDLSDFPKECEDKEMYPLYIGKTTRFPNRLSLHLSLGRKGIWRDQFKEGDIPGDRLEHHMLRKHTTSCQFRSGFEHLFDCEKLGLENLFEQVSISFFPFPLVDEKDRSDVKERFYVEDLAVGYYRPWFNVDSER